MYPWQWNPAYGLPMAPFPWWVQPQPHLYAQAASQPSVVVPAVPVTDPCNAMSAMATMPNATNMGVDQAGNQNAAGRGFSSEALHLSAWLGCSGSACDTPCEPSQMSAASSSRFSMRRQRTSARLLHELVCPLGLLRDGSSGSNRLAP